MEAETKQEVGVGEEEGAWLGVSRGGGSKDENGCKYSDITDLHVVSACGDPCRPTAVRHLLCSSILLP